MGAGGPNDSANSNVFLNVIIDKLEKLEGSPDKYYQRVEDQTIETRVAISMIRWAVDKFYEELLEILKANNLPQENLNTLLIQSFIYYRVKSKSLDIDILEWVLHREPNTNEWDDRQNFLNAMRNFLLSSDDENESLQTLKKEMHCQNLFTVDPQVEEGFRHKETEIEMKQLKNELSSIVEKIDERAKSFPFSIIKPPEKYSELRVGINRIIESKSMPAMLELARQHVDQQYSDDVLPSKNKSQSSIFQKILTWLFDRKDTINSEVNQNIQNFIEKNDPKLKQLERSLKTGYGVGHEENGHEENQALSNSNTYLSSPNPTPVTKSNEFTKVGQPKQNEGQTYRKRS